MNILSKNPYPSCVLSNFAEHHFIFDDVECHSAEGVLQSFKFKDSDQQRQICKLSGYKAKVSGADQVWQDTQTLWWKDIAYNRHSYEYQYLLDRLYLSLFKNLDFQKALLDTGIEPLTHSIGKTNSIHTILTVDEFCSRLMQLRSLLISGVPTTTLTSLNTISLTKTSLLI